MHACVQQHVSARQAAVCWNTWYLPHAPLTARRTLALPCCPAPAALPCCPCCRWVKLRLSTKAIKTVEKRGLQVMADEAGVDLWKLPFEDARPARREWLAANEHNPPMAKNPRAMKNADKLAASTKTPLVARYVHGKIAYVRTEAGAQ